MKKHLAIIALLACPSLAMADNYATCLLDKLPGVQNEAATISAVRLCQADYPGGLTNVAQGAGRGLFASYDSGDECAFEKAKDTRDRRAAQLIGSACLRLYNNPPKPIRPVKLFEDLKAQKNPVAAPLKPSQADIHFAEIYAAHPDADSVVRSEPFISWASSSPDRNRVREEGTADEVIALLSEFKSLELSRQPNRHVNLNRKNPEQRHASCQIKQTMTDADYLACGISPPTK